MLSAQISNVKNKLSYYLQKVRKGEEVIIYDRKTPIAKITKINESDISKSSDLLLDELERRGIIKRGHGKLPKDYFKKNPPFKLPPGVSAVEEFLKMREEESY